MMMKRKEIAKIDSISFGGNHTESPRNAKKKPTTTTTIFKWGITVICFFFLYCKYSFNTFSVAIKTFSILFSVIIFFHCDHNFFFLFILYHLYLSYLSTRNKRKKEMTNKQTSCWFKSNMNGKWTNKNMNK